MKPQDLKFSFRRCAAANLRRAGIGVGDVIVGREQFAECEGSWSEAKLVPVYIGHREVLFRAWGRSSDAPRWRYEGETSDWALWDRPWRLVKRACAADPAPQPGAAGASGGHR